MEKKGKKIKLSTLSISLIWVMLALLVLGGATFAWFTFSTNTNVEPMAGTVGHGGAELLISEYYDGEYSDYISLPVNGETDNLQPVSTSDLENYFTSISQDSSGISNRFKDVSDDINDMSMYGTFYLMSRGDSCSVCFDEENFHMSGDTQLMAAGRLGLKFTFDNGEVEYYIFKLDEFGDTNLAESTDTMGVSDVVISGIGGGGEADTVPDPALSFAPYAAETTNGKKYFSEETLCTLEENEKVTVDYIIYIEGCDENSINAVQENDINLEFAFAGVDVNNES